ncbi:MAG: ferredoxin--NADP reductase [Pseudohongiella sp.]
MTDWVKGVVVTNTHWTDNLFSLRIQADIAPFLAGQYTSLALDVDGERVAQPYSILSGPDEQPLEFFFYTQIEGDLSRALSRKVEGDVVWVQQQPEGTLTLAGITGPGKNLCLMATGTGVAPFVSMLKTDQPWQMFDHVALVYAARIWDDFQYRELFESLTQRYPGRFSLLPFISREVRAGTLHGHIPDKLRNGELEQHMGFRLSPEDSHVMLCGNPGMIKDTVGILQARGFSDNRPGQPGQLSYESYW